MRLTSPEALKALMDDPRRQFSYERLARYSGCSKSFISHLVTGRKKTCTKALAENIAEALSVPVDVLFVETASTDRGETVRPRQKDAVA